jgi:hypothetical protein
LPQEARNRTKEKTQSVHVSVRDAKDNDLLIFCLMFTVLRVQNK